MKDVNFRAYLNSFMVFAFFLVFNLFSNDLSFWKNVSKAMAVASVVLIGITLLLGPLSRFFPNHFRHDLVYRKPLGLAGFAFGLLHGLVAFFNTYGGDLLFTFSEANKNFLPAVYGTVALLILVALAITSTPGAIKKLGFANWKTLQRTGYIAMVFIILHFALLGNGYFLNSTFGKAVFIFGITVLVAKVIVIVLGMKKKHSKEEIKSLSEK